MIEAMICQAFSRIYCPLSLVKPRCTHAYKVWRNRSWEQRIATRCDQVKLCFLFLNCQINLMSRGKCHLCINASSVQTEYSHFSSSSWLHLKKKYMNHRSMLLQQVLCLLDKVIPHLQYHCLIISEQALLHKDTLLQLHSLSSVSIYRIFVNLPRQHQDRSCIRKGCPLSSLVSIPTR